MANPVGRNQLGAPPAYGQIKKLTSLEKAVPIGSTPALGAPKRAQRKAVRGLQATPQSTATAVPVAAPAPATSTPPAVQTAMLWQAAAAAPGASPLVQTMAAQAMRETGIG